MPQALKNRRKANGFLFMIRQSLKVRSYKVLKCLYQTYFVPILLNSCQVWLNPQEQIKTLLHDSFRDFWRLGQGIILPGPEILDTYQSALKLSLSFMFQIKMGKNCLSFEDYFQPCLRGRSAEQEMIQIKRSYHAYRSNCFSNHMTTWFNSLPINIKQASSVDQFKGLLHDHLLRNVNRPNFDFRPWAIRRKKFGV